MRRISDRIPGFNCDTGPCPVEGCPGHGQAPPGLSHGWHGEEWIYVIVDDDHHIALSLTVCESLNFGRYASDLTCHVGFPISRESVLHWSDDWKPCPWLITVPCDCSMSTSLGARDFFCEHGSNAFEQPEQFWAALESRLQDDMPSILSDRADTKWQVCPCCHGDGLVAKE